MKYTFGKEERLKSKKLIEKLYKKGTSIKEFPLRMVFLEADDSSNFLVKVGVSVSKQNFKLAVKRNRIKRLIRETYRLQKKIVCDNIVKPYVIMISYISKEERKYDEIFLKMEKLLFLFVNATQNEKD